MKPERCIEILHECTGISEVDIENDEEIGALSPLTAMQRAVDEETARLKQCEAIVREMAKGKCLFTFDELIHKSRQWVRDNTIK